MEPGRGAAGACARVLRVASALSSCVGMPDCARGLCSGARLSGRVELGLAKGGGSVLNRRRHGGDAAIFRLSGRLAGLLLGQARAACGIVAHFWPRNRVLARNPGLADRKGRSLEAKGQVGGIVTAGLLPRRARTRFRGQKRRIFLHGEVECAGAGRSAVQSPAAAEGAFAQRYPPRHPVARGRVRDLASAGSIRRRLGMDESLFDAQSLPGAGVFRKRDTRSQCFPGRGRPYWRRGRRLARGGASRPASFDHARQGGGRAGAEEGGSAPAG